MKKANKEIREKLERYRIRQCEIADQIGIADTTLCRWMRVEMKPDQRAKVEKAINEIVRKIHEESAL
nr:MAG TPA: regulatory protein/DNA complex-sensing repressor [Bacteriophage sp.]